MEILEFEKEKEHLKNTIESIEKVLEYKQNDLKRLYEDFVGTKDDFFNYVARKKMQISNLEVALDKPYFARIDFISDDTGEKNIVYIGKNNVMDGSKIIVTDWRAPISSLYYDAELGRCSFEAPQGVIDGDLTLKRQFEIESGNLQEYFDVDLVSNDGLLQKYLSNNNDSRLKSIVSTIQKEQNQVIRKKILDNIIVQGVAGSGKTTVALHRIAYLVYNYINSIKQNQYLVIGPNPVFLKYIKSVLPELDVDGVEQCTYEEFAKKYIDEEISVNQSDKKVTDSISGKKTSDIDRFKCSMKYQKMIEQFLELYFLSITSKPLMLGDFEVLPEEVLKDTFNNTLDGYCVDLNERIEITIDRLCSYIESKKMIILKRYEQYAYELFKNVKSQEERQYLMNMYTKDKMEISKNCRNILKKYFSKSKTNTTKLYKLFINSINDFDIYDYKNLNQLKKETMKNIKNNSYDFEDLAALIYIKLFTSSNKNYEKTMHVVIDEAQDLGEFNFFALKKALPMATFSVFGDLAQSIYDYRSISNWDEVNSFMFDNSAEIINFGKSYRTTSQIMSIADDVAESIGLNRSDLVIRQGNDVKIDEANKEQDIPKYIAQKICEYKEKGYKTIAVISKTDQLSKKINESLSNLGIEIPNVSMDDDLNDERFRVCTISNQLAKGLEFDAVIINNANEKNYSSDSSLDMKLLYVAITRALHELDIVYTGELTKPLKSHFEKEKGKQLVKIRE